MMVGGFNRHKDYGFYAATGEWPGGHRYGLLREKMLREYKWSAEERELANEHDIVLPEGHGEWMQETWYDLREDVERTVKSPEFHFLDAPGKTLTPFEVITKFSKRWAIGNWVYDPLVKFREPVAASSSDSEAEDDPSANPA